MSQPRYIVTEDGKTGALGIRDTLRSRDVSTQPLMHLTSDGVMPAYDRELHELGAAFLNQENHATLQDIGTCCCPTCLPGPTTADSAA